MGRNCGANSAKLGGYFIVPQLDKYLKFMAF